MLVYKWCISSQVCIVTVVLSLLYCHCCIVTVVYVCISDEPSVSCVCGYIGLRFVSCLFVCDIGHKSKCLECVCLCVSLGHDLTRRPPLL